LDNLLKSAQKLAPYPPGDKYKNAIGTDEDFLLSKALILSCSKLLAYIEITLFN
jgi:hypothetical protein